MKALIVGVAADITYEHAAKLKEQMEERLGIPVFVISGAVTLTTVDLDNP